MRQRITYIRRQDGEQQEDFDLSRSLQTQNQGLKVRDLKNTAKEHWISVSLDELPDEVRRLLYDTTFARLQDD